MKLMASIQKIADIGKSTRDLQSEISVSEVFHIWDNLVSRYDVIETTQILYNFADDSDLKLILSQGLKFLKDEAALTEQEMIKYGIPLPKKPPASAHSAKDVEAVTDEYIFRRVYAGIQGALPLRMDAFARSTSAKIRDIFKMHLIKEMELYDKFIEYGKLKGWVNLPPKYRD